MVFLLPILAPALPELPAPPPEDVIRKRGGAIVEVLRHDALGRPVTTTAWRGGAPVSVTVHEPAEVVVDVAAWEPVEAGPWVVRTPGGLAFEVDGAEIAVAHVGAEGDPLTEAFRWGLEAACACVLEGRTTASVGGHPAVRYRVRLPDPDVPRLGELWAVDGGPGTLVVRSLTAGGTEALARGRAVVALVSRRAP